MFKTTTPVILIAAFLLGACADENPLWPDTAYAMAKASRVDAIYGTSLPAYPDVTGGG